MKRISWGVFKKGKVENEKTAKEPLTSLNVAPGTFSKNGRVVNGKTAKEPLTS